MTLVVPDLAGALIVRTLTFPNVQALVNSRVTINRPRTKSTDDPNGWDMPIQSVVWRLAGGPGPGLWADVQFQLQRVDVDCYGGDLRAAMQLWRTLHPYLCPLPPLSRAFHAAGCAVTSFEQASSPIPLYEVETQWPRATVSYFVGYSEAPVA